eukprot:6234755-Pyramimonas_sp.AAC.1
MNAAPSPRRRTPGRCAALLVRYGIKTATWLVSSRASPTSARSTFAWEVMVRPRRSLLSPR